MIFQKMKSNFIDRVPYKKARLSPCIILLVFSCLIQTTTTSAQEIPSQIQQQLEDVSGGRETVIEDESWLQDMEEYKKHPLHLNSVNAEELAGLRLLTALQVQSFIRYRTLLGNIISIYELQAIPYWDIPTIRRIIPFITLEESNSIAKTFAARFTRGEHSLLARISQQPERSVGYLGTGDERKYKGSPQHLFFRYRYNYRQLLQFGITADKDAGEQFFSGSGKLGFDHYSAHIFIRDTGPFQAIALGDYTLNMGQGLIQWQSLAFSKSGDAINCKRQSALLRPFTSSGEFYFFRGAAFTIKRKSISVTAFTSLRKLDANKVIDSASGETFISSIQNSGYHRTTGEIIDHNLLTQFSYGGVVALTRKDLHAAFNFVAHYFDTPFEKPREPYDLFAITGKQWYNASVSYEKTFRNFHFFGETAIDRNQHLATVNGILLSVDPRIDLALHYRNISMAYRAIYGNAFTEGSTPNNERSIYAGICFRPTDNLRMDLFCDLFQFPWLRYRIDAPSMGSEQMMQFTYTPSKQSELTMRFRFKSKGVDQLKGNVNEVKPYQQYNWRIQFTRSLFPALALRARTEYCRYESNTTAKQEGFLLLSDLLFHPAQSKWSGNMRLSYFETGGFESRVYAFENDVLYNFAIPAYSGKGFRYYINLGFDALKNITLWARWAQTFYGDTDHSGSGNDKVESNHKSEITLQLRCIF